MLGEIKEKKLKKKIEIKKRKGFVQVGYRIEEVKKKKSEK